MLTECPQCQTPHRVSAAHLRMAMGMVRCSRCHEVFNALASLRDEDVPAAPVKPRAGRRAGGAARVLARGEAPPRGEVSLEAPPPAVAHAVPPGHAGRWLPGSLGLAWRNLLRQGRRTGFGLAAVTFGVVALLLAGGFMEWVFWAMRESYIQSRLGHIQVARMGYFEQGGSDPFAFLLPGESPILRAVEAVGGVQAVTPRLGFSGLASHGETTVSFIGEGVDPETEVAVSGQLTIEQGQNLSTADPQGVIVGMGLAENLGVVPGSNLVLLTTTESGSVSATEARVRGLFRTSSKAFDDTVLRTPIAMARSLLRTDGAHAWVVLLDETEATDRALAEVRAALATGQDGAAYEARPWYELTDFYQKTVELFSRQINVVRVVIAVIIVVSISNTLIMGVLERTAEIGTLMALGQRRRQILQLFVNEGLLLGLVGGAAGVALGHLAAAGISAVGIPMPPPPGMEVGFLGEIRLTPALAASAFALAVLATLLASLYPAWRASRLPIVDALRHAR